MLVFLSSGPFGKFVVNYYKAALISATVLSALAIIFGAFGAHALSKVLSPKLIETFKTAVLYQLFHAFAFFALAFFLAAIIPLSEGSRGSLSPF